MPGTSSIVIDATRRCYRLVTLADTKRPRVLLGDDRPSTIDRWRALLEPQFEVVGDVADGESLVQAAARLKPDVVVTNIEIPGFGGVAAAENIKRERPQTRIVFTTQKADRTMMRKSLVAGASGYVLQPRAASDLVPAVRAALRGELMISPFEEEPEDGRDR
jgi:DNA-binding NarL/FixJ family response regulator